MVPGPQSFCPGHVKVVVPERICLHTLRGKALYWSLFIRCQNIFSAEGGALFLRNVQTVLFGWKHEGWIQVHSSVVLFKPFVVFVQFGYNHLLLSTRQNDVHTATCRLHGVALDKDVFQFVAPRQRSRHQIPATQTCQILGHQLFGHFAVAGIAQALSSRIFVVLELQKTGHHDSRVFRACQVDRGDWCHLSVFELDVGQHEQRSTRRLRIVHRAADVGNGLTTCLKLVFVQADVLDDSEHLLDFFMPRNSASH
mmetsp:Transcript_28077/g.66671  ORF Transcript_28077/g.66671 Transcript_28077/m.66671 type:complete len:254 (-) Transcript_28077:1964-2725(-)